MAIIIWRINQEAADVMAGGPPVMDTNLTMTTHK